MKVAAFQEPNVLGDDFFRTCARVPLSNMFLIAGAPATILTNSEAIMNYAEKLFLRLDRASVNPGFTLRLWVSRESGESHEDAKPCFRGLGRFLFAGFGGANFLAVDLAKRLVAGRFTANFAADETVWKKTVFTVIVAMVAPTVGVSVLHCAAVEQGQRGLILAGPSGSGKSTLSLALGQQGLGLLADDRTSFSLQHGRLLAWSIGAYWKLRAEASQYFPNLMDTRTVRTSSDGLSVTLDPEETLGLRRSSCCEPDWLVFLERQSNETCDLAPLSPAEAAIRLEEGLYEETPEGVESQLAVISELVKRPCHILRYGLNPDETARYLCERFKSKPRSNYSASTIKHSQFSLPRRLREDPLRRFTPLPYRICVSLMGRHGELHTNSSQILEYARRLFPIPDGAIPGEPQFTWRTVAEEVDSAEEPWPDPTGFSSRCLRLLRLHMKCFIAVDTETADGVGIFPASKGSETVGVAGVFLPGLFYATAPALGLTPLACGCISDGERGLLLLGPPGAGKTTCAYAARKLGLDFQSGMVTFLEVRDGRLLAHGELWPTIFRRETAQFYPELLFLGRPLRHVSQTFLAVDRTSIGSTSSRRVIPTAAVYLERSATGSPRLSRLSPLEFTRNLTTKAPFQEEEDRFQAQRDTVYEELKKIPAYRLAYRGDPAEAAVFCRSLLRTHGGIGAL